MTPLLQNIHFDCHRLNTEVPNSLLYNLFLDCNTITLLIIFPLRIHHSIDSNKHIKISLHINQYINDFDRTFHLFYTNIINPEPNSNQNMPRILTLKLFNLVPQGKLPLQDIFYINTKYLNNCYIIRKDNLHIEKIHSYYNPLYILHKYIHIKHYLILRLYTFLVLELRFQQINYYL